MLDRRMSTDRTRALLPRFIMRWRLSTTRLAQLLSGAIKMARQLEKYVRPRLAFLPTVPGMRRLIGVGIIIAGLALMLPLPIPFSNSIPAWAIVLLAVGMMENTRALRTRMR